MDSRLDAPVNILGPFPVKGISQHIGQALTVSAEGHAQGPGLQIRRHGKGRAVFGHRTGAQCACPHSLDIVTKDLTRGLIVTAAVFADKRDNHGRPTQFAACFDAQNNIYGVAWREVGLGQVQTQPGRHDAPKESPGDEAKEQNDDRKGQVCCNLVHMLRCASPRFAAGCRELSIGQEITDLARIGRGILLIGVMATPAFAETTQDVVLDCFAQMDQTTDWNMCLNTMFAPCADETIGSNPHLECLIGQGNDWRAAQESAETEILDKLSTAGAETLTGLLSAWPKFVDEKCSGVAQGRAGISFEAALIGCQISEYALMTNELTNCLEGRSTEAYCQIEE